MCTCVHVPQESHCNWLLCFVTREGTWTCQPVDVMHKRRVRERWRAHRNCDPAVHVQINTICHLVEEQQMTADLTGNTQKKHTPHYSRVWQQPPSHTVSNISSLICLHTSMSLVHAFDKKQHPTLKTWMCNTNTQDNLLVVIICLFRRVSQFTFVFMLQL